MKFKINIKSLNDQMEELRDKIDALESELNYAIEVAYVHGAQDWVALNYPKEFRRLRQMELRADIILAKDIDEPEVV